MRIALIPIDTQPQLANGGGPITVGGRSLALRQLDFLLAAGAERVIGIGQGASPVAVDLRLAAEAAGARFQTVSDARGLFGMVGTPDDLLVVTPGLLPESPLAIDALLLGHGVLTLPEASIAQGFERIDRDRAWAGVARVPGALVERMADLPDDVAIPSTLMRLALQARVAERRLDHVTIAQKGWTLVLPGDAAAGGALDGAWLQRNLPAPPAGNLAAALAWPFLRGQAGAILRSRHGAGPWRIAQGVVLPLAIAAGAWGAVAGSFLVLAAGQLAGALAGGISALRAAPFARQRPAGAARWLRGMADLALCGCAALGGSGTVAQQLFPAVMLLAGLHLKGPLPRAVAWLQDRLVLALVLALAGLTGHVPLATMAVALALVGARVDPTGITRN